MRNVFFLALLTLLFVSCAVSAADSPSAAIKIYIDAARVNNVAALRGVMSSGTLAMLDKDAQSQSVTTDELLWRISKAAAANKGAQTETRNEIINGDAATVEIKNQATNAWDKIPLVRENGSWKIALDKYMEDLMKGFEQG